MKKLFVSSTFKDMQLERDALKKHIIPELNMRLRAYGTQISQTDLRWGISTSELSAEEGEQKILNVCLDEINKSRPYMIVMLGERYGWIPSPAIIEMNANGRGVSLPNNEISVTQLEIEYIAFTEKWDESRIFFYFRDLDCQEMDEQMRSVYAAESDEAEKKLTALKQRIREKFPNQIRPYTLHYENGEIRGIEQFEKLVTDDLYGLFNRDLKEDEGTDVNLRVRNKFHAEALENFAIFDAGFDIARNKSKRMICSPVTKDELTHCYIGGSPRCGKSLSVLSHYAAFYAYLHKEEPCWQQAEALFHKGTHYLEADGPFSQWPDIIPMESTFPLCLRVGNCKDLADNRDFLRTFLFFLNRHLAIEEPLPTEEKELLQALCQSLRLLMGSEKGFYLFVDDLTPSALYNLFEIEHAFSEEEIPLLMSHFFFYISFNDQFSKVPSYVPFHEHCERCSEHGELYPVADYFFDYAKKLGKELSPGVTKYLTGNYGGYGKSDYGAELTHITMPHANLMANYFMNFTAEDFRKIKAAGNDMQAIESHQLSLLHDVRGNLHDDLSGESLKKVALLCMEKYEENQSEVTLKTLGILYILSGIAFSMEEAKWLYSYFDLPWSDLEYISYFNDFKEFFLYNEEEDSYLVLPQFHLALRLYFTEHHLSGREETKNALRNLIRAVKSAPFAESKCPLLFSAILTVSDSDFIYQSFLELLQNGDDGYLPGKAMGKSVSELLATLLPEEVRALATALAPILGSRLSLDAISGFFDGMKYDFQDHSYGKKVMLFANALSEALPAREDPLQATCSVCLTLLKAKCYLGWKNDKALHFLTEGEKYLATADLTKKVRYLSVLSSLLRTFQPESPVFLRLCAVIKRHLPPELPLSEDTDRALSLRADMYTLAFFVKKFSLAEDYYDPEELLTPFLNEKNFCKLGLSNIETAIYAQSAKEIGFDALLARTRLFMERLAADFPSDPYAARLIAYSMLSRFFNTDPDRSDALEKYFYPYQKNVFLSCDNSAYHFVQYALFLQNALYFHKKTGITKGQDEILWEATEMGHWPCLFRDPGEESIDVILRICWSYVTYLRIPGFHDMLSEDGAKEAYQYCEEGAEEPSMKALHYRLTVYLAAVLHNPSSRIIKTKLKRLFHMLEEYYGDYLPSLSTSHYKTVKKYIEEI